MSIVQLPSHSLSCVLSSTLKSFKVFSDTEGLPKSAMAQTQYTDTKARDFWMQMTQGLKIESERNLALARLDSLFRQTLPIRVTVWLVSSVEAASAEAEFASKRAKTTGSAETSVSGPSFFRNKSHKFPSLANSLIWLVQDFLEAVQAFVLLGLNTVPFRCPCCGLESPSVRCTLHTLLRAGPHILSCDLSCMQQMCLLMSEIFRCFLSFTEMKLLLESPALQGAWIAVATLASSKNVAKGVFSSSDGNIVTPAFLQGVFLHWYKEIMQCTDFWLFLVLGHTVAANLPSIVLEISKPLDPVVKPGSETPLYLLCLSNLPVTWSPGCDVAGQVLVSHQLEQSCLFSESRKRVHRSLLLDFFLQNVHFGMALKWSQICKQDSLHTSLSLMSQKDDDMLRLAPLRELKVVSSMFSRVLPSDFKVMMTNFCIFGVSVRSVCHDRFGFSSLMQNAKQAGLGLQMSFVSLIALRHGRLFAYDQDILDVDSKLIRPSENWIWRWLCACSKSFCGFRKTLENTFVRTVLEAGAAACSLPKQAWPTDTSFRTCVFFDADLG